MSFENLVKEIFESHLDWMLVYSELYWVWFVYGYDVTRTEYELSCFSVMHLEWCYDYNYSDIIEMNKDFYSKSYLSNESIKEIEEYWEENISWLDMLRKINHID